MDQSDAQPDFDLTPSPDWAFRRYPRVSLPGVVRDGAGIQVAAQKEPASALAPRVAAPCRLEAFACSPRLGCKSVDRTGPLDLARPAVEEEPPQEMVSLKRPDTARYSFRQPYSGSRAMQAALAGRATTSLKLMIPTQPLLPRIATWVFAVMSTVAGSTGTRCCIADHADGVRGLLHWLQ